VSNVSEPLILGCLLTHGPEAGEATGIRREDFATPARGELWQWLHRNRDQWTAGNAETILAAVKASGLGEKLGNPNGLAFELMEAADGVCAKGFAHYAQTFLDVALARQLREAAADLTNGKITPAIFSRIYTALSDRRGQGGQSSALDLLKSRRFNRADPPPKPEPLYSIGGASIATAGNLIVLQAQSKAGKSAFLGAMLAAAMHPEASEEMTLGIRSSGACGKAIIHFDTEQSRHDHHSLVERSLTRSSLDIEPHFLRSYCVTDLAIGERLAAMRAEIANAGKVFALFLDGVADFVHDPNDPAEAFALVGELHRLAIEHDCAIICVLHENPGAVTGKTRGHLGSQLERKAETNLRMEKGGDEVTCVWTERARHCFIPKAKGLRFAYCPTAGMHLPAESANDARTKAAADELTAFTASVFEGQKNGLSWRELIDRMILVGKLKESGARTRLTKMTEKGLIQKNLLHKWEFAA
jgi:hypothetical protein